MQAPQLAPSRPAVAAAAVVAAATAAAVAVIIACVATTAVLREGWGEEGAVAKGEGLCR